MIFRRRGCEAAIRLTFGNVSAYMRNVNDYIVSDRVARDLTDVVRCRTSGPTDVLSLTLDKMGTTAQDVAEEAGVSIATVSRVFNDSDRVRDGTRRRVLDAAHALGYVPNQAARSLKMQQTNTIGVVIPDMQSEFFAEVIRGIDRTARKQGYHLLLASSHDAEDEIRTVMNTIRGRVDGLVVLWPHEDASFLNGSMASAPVVLLNAFDEDASVPVLRIDNRAGAFEAVAHLADHGHERIATFTGPPENVDARERLLGYRDAVRKRGLVADGELEITGDFCRETGEDLVADLMALTPCPTALFAANDFMAIGALRSLRRAGLCVPDDMALIGFDDIPTARYVTPPLATMRVPMHDLGRRAMLRMLALLRDEPPEELPQGSGGATVERASTGLTETLATTLITRASCGCTDS